VNLLVLLEESKIGALVSLSCSLKRCRQHSAGRRAFLTVVWRGVEVLASLGVGTLSGGGSGKTLRVPLNGGAEGIITAESPALGGLSRLFHSFGAPAPSESDFSAGSLLGCASDSFVGLERLFVVRGPKGMGPLPLKDTSGGERSISGVGVGRSSLRTAGFGSFLDLCWLLFCFLKASSCKQGTDRAKYLPMDIILSKIWALSVTSRSGCDGESIMGHSGALPSAFLLQQGLSC
jgi:hypothetical protein